MILKSFSVTTIFLSIAFLSFASTYSLYTFDGKLYENEEFEVTTKDNIVEVMNDELLNVTSRRPLSPKEKEDLQEKIRLYKERRVQKEQEKQQAFDKLQQEYEKCKEENEKEWRRKMHLNILQKEDLFNERRNQEIIWKNQKLELNKRLDTIKNMDERMRIREKEQDRIQREREALRARHEVIRDRLMNERYKINDEKMKKDEEARERLQKGREAIRNMLDIKYK